MNETSSPGSSALVGGALHISVNSKSEANPKSKYSNHPNKKALVFRILNI
jgi:hypothetical protein